MLPLQDTALALLDGLLADVEYARAHHPELLWPSLVSALHGLEAHPVTGSLLRAVPAVTMETCLWDVSGAPADAAEWGRRAYAFIRLVQGRDIAGSSAIGATGRRLQTHGLVQISLGESRDLAGRQIALYVRPLIHWLRAEILAGRHLSTAIDRWIQRVHLFGPGFPPDDEIAVQDDLHRYLFDAGLEPHHEFLREVTVGRGRVDFVLRQDEVVPVELKLYRSGALALEPWSFQAGTYAAHLRLRQAYLVVAHLDPGERLDPQGDLRHGGPLRVRGVDVHVRFVDLAARAPSRDARERAIRTVTAADIRLDTPSGSEE